MAALRQLHGELEDRNQAARSLTEGFDETLTDRLLTRVLYGISCRNYAAAAEAIPGAIGLSGSTVSRTFIQASAAKLHEFHERDLSNENVVAIVLDGKTFAEATMVIALGITMTGEKRFLGFVETDTENAQVLTPFLRSLLERGLDISQGVLVILDGGKGSGRPFGRLSVAAPWSNGVSGTSGRTWSAIWPRPSNRCGGSASSERTTAGIRRGRGCAQAAAWRVGGSESIGGPQSD